MCLESKDYTQIRNTIMVLTKVCPAMFCEENSFIFSVVVEWLRVEQ